MFKVFYKTLFFLYLLSSSSLTGEEPPPIGNFALPDSQQPYGLFALGGNIIDKNEYQLLFFADYFIGEKKTIIDLIPSILYGIRDDLSIFFSFPFLKLRDGNQQSSGLGDFFCQIEYAFYNSKTADYIDQATVLGNITTPTGSVYKNPSTGFGSPSVSIGYTFTRMMIEWFIFTTQATTLTTSNSLTKIGDQFFYQFGFGKSFFRTDEWIYSLMLELDGQYSKKNKINGVIDNNSGGNIILTTPSIFISTKYFLFQFGASIPIQQNLYGNQNKIDFALNLNIAWSFYPD